MNKCGYCNKELKRNIYCTNSHRVMQFKKMKKEKCKEKKCNYPVYKKGWCRGHLGLEIGKLLLKEEKV